MDSNSTLTRRSALRLAGLGVGASLLPMTSNAKAGNGDHTTVTVVLRELRTLDPIIGSGSATREHGYLVYDTLLAIDDKFRVQPQMADWQVSDDKLSYTFKLRDGLKWHDGASVRAEDCVASLLRWSKADQMGRVLFAKVSSLTAVDERSFVLKLSEPYGLVLDSLGKPGAFVPFMMPKRLAETPNDRPIPEQIGSGPFKFVATEFRPGVRAVYLRNKDYVARTEPPNWLAGSKATYIDRINWVSIPDPQTANNALMAGEVDLIEQPPWDTLPLLKADKDIVVHTLNPYGTQAMARMNFIHPPFNDLRVRRAAMLAFNQADFMTAAVGDRDYWRTCGAVLGCGTRFANEEGAKSLVGSGSMAEARDLLKQSGYNGAPVVLVSPTDVPYIQALSLVAAQLLRDAGFSVDVQSMDFNTQISRIFSKNPPDQGGWNIFFTAFSVTDISNPISHPLLNSSGLNSGVAGWADDRKIEELREAFARALTEEERVKVAREIQLRVLDQVIYVPLGELKMANVWRKELSGVLDGPSGPVFWNMRKAK